MSPEDARERLPQLPGVREEIRPTLIAPSALPNSLPRPRESSLQVQPSGLYAQLLPGAFHQIPQKHRARHRRADHQEGASADLLLRLLPEVLPTAKSFEAPHSDSHRGGKSNAKAQMR